MSTRAQRRERAQSRRKPDPVADRIAARDAIVAQYDTAATAAYEEALVLARQIWAVCDRKREEAWAERCRKLTELEEREIPEAELELELEAHPGTAELAADLRGESIGAQQERADIEESGL